MAMNTATKVAGTLRVPSALRPQPQVLSGRTARGVYLLLFLSHIWESWKWQ
jgi:hypothetical protein